MSDKSEFDTLIKNFEELADFLKQKENLRKIDPDQHRVEVTVCTNHFQGEIMIIWEKKKPLIQLILPLPIQIPEARLPATESAVARLNHFLVVPGFGIDHASRFAYYRLCVPRNSNEQLLSKDLEQLFKVVLGTVNNFYPGLVGVILQNKESESVISLSD